VKRLYKSRKNKVIDGVCGGIADYFDVDPVLVRVIFVLFFFFGGSAIIAYIVGMLIMPRAPLQTVQEQGVQEPGKPPEPGEGQGEPSANVPVKTETEKPVPASTSAGSLIIGILLIVIGGIFLMSNFDFPLFPRFFWWFRHHFWDFFIPGIIIVLGLVLIIKGTEE
jgi:phage shock protein C